MNSLLFCVIITFLDLIINVFIVCLTYEWYKHTKDE